MASSYSGSRLMAASRFLMPSSTSGPLVAASSARTLLSVSGPRSSGFMPISARASIGVAYKLDTTGHETVLYSFTGGADGAYPVGVIRDSAGNLYGTTDSGGAANSGVVYKLDTAGHETVLYRFTGGADG